MIHLDTSFLIDLLRERRAGRESPARRLLLTLKDEPLWISVHVACELFAGAEHSGHPRREREKVERLCEGVQIAYPSPRFAPTYGQLCAALERRGQRIGAIDLLIATAAVVDDAPLVTRDTKDFLRVPGLRLLTY